jgi:hypothetical protein
MASAAICGPALSMLDSLHFLGCEQDMVKPATLQIEGFYSSVQKLLAKGSDSSSDATLE